MNVLKEENIKSSVLFVGVLAVIVIGTASCCAYLDKQDEKSKIAYAEEYMEDHALDYVIENQYDEMIDYARKHSDIYDEGYSEGYEDGFKDGEE